MAIDTTKVKAQILRWKNNIASAYTEAENKGATMPTVRNSDNLPATIASIPSGSPQPPEPEEWNTATKTLALSDANKLFLCASTSDQTLTIPTHGSVPLPIGTMISFLLTSTNAVTFSGASGVTLTSIDSLVVLATQYGMASLIKTDTNTWQLVGALESKPVSSENYVRFVSGSSRTITPKYTNSGITLQYSVDSGETWTTISSGNSTTSSTEHWFRGQATGTKSLFTSNDNANAWAFSGSSYLEVYGNLNFLLCDTLGDEEAPTSLGSYCYSSMFRGCTSLTIAPALPAKTMATFCYSSMFRGCTSLTIAPALPATTMATFCYSSMFNGCTSLTTAPALPATTLAEGCYNYMFSDCTSLTTAPALPATTLADDCYNYMFNGCTSFKVSATNTGAYTYAWRIPTSGTGTSATNWNNYMLRNTGGTFTSNPTINKTYYVENEPV